MPESEIEKRYVFPSSFVGVRRGTAAHPPNLTPPILPPFFPDGLQCVLVQRLVRDLNFATKVVVHDTVREPDGLALSSRNRFLTAEERDAAPLVFSALLELSQAHRAGERNPYALRRKAEAVIAAEPLMKLEYVSVADAATGRELDAPLAEAARPLMASIAVKIGSTRLIDNVVLGA